MAISNILNYKPTDLWRYHRYMDGSYDTGKKLNHNYIGTHLDYSVTFLTEYLQREPKDFIDKYYPVVSRDEQNIVAGISAITVVCKYGLISELNELLFDLGV